MRHTDLLLVAPVKYGGWMIKNPSVVQIGHTQNGVSEIWMWNAAMYGVKFYARMADVALEIVADMIAEGSGIMTLHEHLEALMVPESVYLENTEDKE